MEYYLDSILIWIESLFLECNTPDPSIKTQKDSAEKDDYSSTKTVLHLSKKKNELIEYDTTYLLSH